jgi:hypothetical protein
MIQITDIINKNTTEHKAVFSHYRKGKLYYNVVDQAGKAWYEFPVDITDTADIGDTSFMAEYKAITMMRYIRKAIASDTIQKLVL